MKASDAWKKHETIKEAREAFEKNARAMFPRGAVNFNPGAMFGAHYDARIVAAEAVQNVFIDQFDEIALRALASLRDQEKASLAEAIAATTDEVSR